MKALVVVSFGTSIPEARAAIENVENTLKAGFADREFFRAFTSGIIRRKLAKSGEVILSLQETLDELKSKGYTDVLVQPTHIIPGKEYDKMAETIDSYRECFEKIVFGEPLVCGTEDLRKVVKIVGEKWIPSNGRLVLMGHGTDHRNNIIYLALQSAFAIDYPEKVMVGTVEGWPEIGELISMLKAANESKVTLAPFMLVAGDHARNDMAGEEEDSWKSRLEKEGFSVDCILDGLGSIPEIWEMYAVKAASVLEK